MAKISKKLPRSEVEKMFYKLCVVIARTNSAEDAAKLLRDLLSFTEAEVIAKRIKIAEMLLEKKTYNEIIDKLKVSSTTIFKVQEWLAISGDGYRNALKKAKGDDFEKVKNNTSYNLEEWSAMKKKFPMYYWPEVLLENIIATSNKKQKRKIESVIGQMEKMKEKNELYARIRKLLKK